MKPYDMGALLLKVTGLFVILIEIIYYYFIVKDEKTQLLMAHVILYTIFIFFMVCAFIPTGVDKKVDDDDDGFFFYKISLAIIAFIHMYYFIENEMYVSGILILLIELMVAIAIIIVIGGMFSSTDKPVDGIYKVMDNILVYTIFNGFSCIGLPLLFAFYLMRRDDADDAE